MRSGASKTIKTRQGLEARVMLWNDGSIDLTIEGKDPRERYPLIALSMAPREADLLRAWLKSDVVRS